MGVALRKATVAPEISDGFGVDNPKSIAYVPYTLGTVYSSVVASCCSLLLAMYSMPTRVPLPFIEHASPVLSFVLR